MEKIIYEYFHWEIKTIQDFQNFYKNHIIWVLIDWENLFNIFFKK